MLCRSNIFNRVCGMPGCHFRIVSQGSTGGVLEKLCKSKYLGCDSFVICLGVIGALFTITDVFRIMRGGLSLADDMWRRRDSGSVVVNCLVERDLKLLSSIIGAEHYIFLILGSFYGKSVLLTPWLVVQGFVIVLEVFIFFMKLISGGVVVFKGQLLIHALLLHNWLQVFCFYEGME